MEDCRACVDSGYYVERLQASAEVLGGGGSWPMRHRSSLVAGYSVESLWDKDTGVSKLFDMEFGLLCDRCADAGSSDMPSE